MNQHYGDNACPVSERHASAYIITVSNNTLATVYISYYIDLQLNTTIENHKAI